MVGSGDRVGQDELVQLIDKVLGVLADKRRCLSDPCSLVMTS